VISPSPRRRSAEKGKRLLSRTHYIESARDRSDGDTLRRGHRTGLLAFGVHALACLRLNLMAVLPCPRLHFAEERETGVASGGSKVA
jgi:hypothetical protein